MKSSFKNQCRDFRHMDPRPNDNKQTQFLNLCFNNFLTDRTYTFCYIYSLVLKQETEMTEIRTYLSFHNPNIIVIYRCKT